MLLMPSLARMKWPWLIATWIISWTPLMANWWGPRAWHFGNLMSVFFWLGIYFSKKAPRVKEIPAQHGPLKAESQAGPLS